MSERLRKILTLVFVREPGKILLGLKKRGFGCGLWNGFGGKVEKNETILQGAKRELVEECGIQADVLERIGLINFEFENDPVIMEVHVFLTFHYIGDPVETEEMKPEWYKDGEIPFNQMWPDDKYWFPYMLQKRKFEAYFLFKGMDTILDYWIKESLNDCCSSVNKII
ncbi:7 8-dihydro-8-oxoguanine triphosphatase isoform X4 [Biomphalaria pfeifferi]|uniref:Oxidized purine nucleoside triphosphate hydrolase n=1 Tax=Biomphalaria pfeifferi TaxID=112525 RepID=A0AAD8B740_BIOPF|nr:7 8-dihydro-8-oxoguanine triphosphatase isoform X4 [Biomphalaria pfeifferi]